MSKTKPGFRQVTIIISESQHKQLKKKAIKQHGSIQQWGSETVKGYNKQK